MSDFVAGGAWVEVKPRLDTFERDLLAGIDRAMARLRSLVENTAESIEDSFTEAARESQQQLSLFDGDVFDAVRESAQRTGEQIENAFAEAEAAATNSLQQLDDRSVWSRITSAAERAGERIENSMQEASRQSRHHLGLIGVAVGGLGTLVAGAGIGAGIIAAVDQASDLSESINAINVVLGDAAGSFLNFGEQADTALGMTQSALNTAVVPMAALLKNAGLEGEGLSSQLQLIAQSAADTGSVLNKDVNEVLTAFGAAVRGELEPARALGISFNDAAVEAKALELGLVDANGAVTEAGKVQARLALVLEQSEQHAGDFARTANSLPNLLKQIKASGLEAAAGLGEALLPAIQSTLGGALDMVRNMGPQLGALGTALGDSLTPAFEAIGPLLEVIVDRSASFVGVLGKAFGALAPLIEPISTLLGGVAEIVANLAGTVIDALAPAFETIAGVLNDTLADVMPVIQESFEELAPTIGEIAEILGGVLAAVLPDVARAFTLIVRAVAPLLPILADGILVALRALEPILPIIVRGWLAIAAATKIWAIAQGALNVILSANPIGLIVVAIGALVIGVIEAYKRSETFRAIVQKLWDVIKATGEAIAGAFVAAWNALVTAFDAVNRAGEAVERFFTELPQKLLDIGAKALDLYVEYWLLLPVKIGNALLDLAPTVLDAITAAGQAMLDAGLRALELYVKYWLLLPVQVAAALIVLAPTVAEKFIELGERMIQIVEDGIRTVLRFFADLPSNAANALANLGAFVWAKWDALVDGTIQRVSTMVEQVLTFFRNLPGQVGGAISSLASTAAAKFQEMVDTTIATVRTWVTNLITEAQQLPGKLANGLVMLASAIGGKFDSMFSSVRGKVSEWVSGAGDWLADLPSKMIAGLGGLTSTVTNFVRNTLEDAINTAIDAANRLLPNSVGFGPASINLPDNPLPRVNLAHGDIVWQETLARIGERNMPEVVVPMTRPRRAIELLEESGLADLVRASSRGGDGMAVNFNGGQTFQDSTDADLVAQRTYAAFQLARAS